MVFDCGMSYINLAGWSRKVLRWQRVSEDVTGELQSGPVKSEGCIQGQYCTFMCRGIALVGCRGKVERCDVISVERGNRTDRRSFTCICGSHDQKISCHS